MVKRIDKLTPLQESRMGEWRDKWIRIGLQTGDADFVTFESAIKVAYEKAHIPFPNKIIHVQSPIVGALAASISRGIIQDFGQSEGDAVGGAVGGAVRDATTRWHDWSGGQFWVGGWYWGSPSFISFFTDICDLELSPDIMERAKSYRDICTSVNYFWPNTEFVMVCDRPQFIGRDSDGRLHNDQRKAIEYKDGWGLYALDGVVLDEGVWYRIISQEMTFDEIVAIENADVRAVALKYNKNAIISSGAELLDEHPQFGELFLIKGKSVNTLLEEKELYFLRMKCPTGRVFVECVEPSFAKKYPYAMQCQANAFGVSPEIYGQLQVRNEG